MTGCNLARRVAFDRARNAPTRSSARRFVRSHCPCSSCHAWRTDPATVELLDRVLARIGARTVRT